MTRMSPMTVVLATLLLAAGGCVSQGDADALQVQNRRLQEQVVDLQAQIEARNEEIRLLQTATRPVDQQTLDLITKLREDRDRLAAALSETEAKLRNLGTIRIEDALPAPLSSALADLARANPDIMEYDAARGMVKLRSDLTFALGSVEISPAGKQALQELGTVVNSEAAVGFGVRIIGHTDNVPVTNPANRTRFVDNWGLSAFRAISVKSVMQSAGVSPTRLEIAGRGEFQPIVANGPKGAEANRRVEIFLVRMPGAGVADAGASATPKTATVDEAEGPEAFK